MPNLICHKTFKYYRGGLYRLAEPAHVELAYIVDVITSDPELQKGCEHIGLLKDCNPAGAKLAKYKLPLWYPGEDIRGNATGLLYLDFDGIENPQAARQALIDSFTNQLVMCHVSASGKGLHAFFVNKMLVSRQQYVKAWQRLANDCEDIGLIADNRMCSVSNVATIAFDKDCYYNQAL